MFCVNCFYPNTIIINSRPHKKQPQVWRRHKCKNCHTVFTTYERLSLANNKAIFLSQGQSETFNLGKLTISISKAFSHSPHDAEYNSLWLAETVEDTLSVQCETITVEDIAAVTHITLKKFDELAAIQYAVQHKLISSVKKHVGRPSIHERE